MECDLTYEEHIKVVKAFLRFSSTGQLCNWGAHTLIKETLDGIWKVKLMNGELRNSY